MDAGPTRNVHQVRSSQVAAGGPRSKFIRHGASQRQPVACYASQPIERAKCIDHGRSSEQALQPDAKVRIVPAIVRASP